MYLASQVHAAEKSVWPSRNFHMRNLCTATPASAQYRRLHMIKASIFCMPSAARLPCWAEAKRLARSLPPTLLQIRPSRPVQAAEPLDTHHSSVSETALQKSGPAHVRVSVGFAGPLVTAGQEESHLNSV